MSQPPPSYPVPSGYPPGTPPLPPKKRPSGWWFVVGGVLIAAAVAAAVGLFIWTISGLFQTDATVLVDGQSHAVEVPTDGDRMLWIDQTMTTPRCRVVDAATDRKIPLRPVSGEFQRSNGSAGDWLGLWRFDPGSGRLEVTCIGALSRPTASVEIGPAPRIGTFVGGILATIFIPLFLGLAGLAILIVTGILFATRPARPKPV